MITQVIAITALGVGVPGTPEIDRFEKSVAHELVIDMQPLAILPKNRLRLVDGLLCFVDPESDLDIKNELGSTNSLARDNQRQLLGRFALG